MFDEIPEISKKKVAGLLKKKYQDCFKESGESDKKKWLKDTNQERFKVFQSKEYRLDQLCAKELANITDNQYTSLRMAQSKFICLYIYIYINDARLLSTIANNGPLSPIIVSIICVCVY